MKREAVEIIKILASAAMGALIIIQFVTPMTVFGNSMEPLFSDRDYVVLYRHAYMRDKTPQRGEIVVFRSHLLDKDGSNKKLVKRVIAVEGDKISIEDGDVFLNGELLEEDYVKDGVTSGNVRPVTVPEGKVFCMGDNRLYSQDSRHSEVGMISEKDILGKVIFGLLPVKKAGKIE